MRFIVEPDPEGLDEIDAAWHEDLRSRGVAPAAVIVLANSPQEAFEIVKDELSVFNEHPYFVTQIVESKPVGKFQVDLVINPLHVTEA